MKILHEIYGLGVDDTRYRSKLKQSLKDYFNDNISFLQFTNKNTEEVIANTGYIVDKESQIRATAK